MSKPSPTHSLPPFPAYPAADRYVPTGSVRDALDRVCRAVESGEAISLVIGPPGVGKSMLCDLIAARHQTSHDVVILNQAPVEDRGSLIRHLLHHLGADFRNIPETDLHLALVDHVCGEAAKPGGLLIMVDEAQSLSQELLEAIRMVTNITHQGRRRITAVLAGGPKMDDALVSPAMEALVQRVATRCYLHPMNEGETSQYVRRTMEQCFAGGKLDISSAAISAVHLACTGVPRLVNQLMTAAIDWATSRDTPHIDDQTVGAAWAELQQLPSPMVDEAEMVAPSAVEFAPLSDWSGSDAREESATMATEPHVAPAPTAEELFGNFDAEEEVAIASTAKPASDVGHGCSSDPEPGCGTQCCSDSMTPAEIDGLEESLHQQIVGMTETLNVAGCELPAEEADRAREASTAENDEAANAELSADDRSQDDISDLPPLGFESIEDEVDLRLADAMGDVMWREEPPAHGVPCEVVSDNADAQRSAPSHVASDRDLLIVEEDVELRFETPEEAEVVVTPTDVDMQAMLSRLRTGH